MPSLLSLAFSTTPAPFIGKLSNASSVTWLAQGTLPSLMEESGTISWGTLTPMARPRSIAMLSRAMPFYSMAAQFPGFLGSKKSSLFQQQRLSMSQPRTQPRRLSGFAASSRNCSHLSRLQRPFTAITKPLSSSPMMTTTMHAPNTLTSDITLSGKSSPMTPLNLYFAPQMIWWLIASLRPCLSGRSRCTPARSGCASEGECWIGAYTALTAASPEAPEAPEIHHAWSHPNFWSLVGFVPTYYTLSFPLIVLLYYLLLSYHTYPFIIGPHTCTRLSPLSLNTLTRTCVSYCLTLIPYLATCLIYLQM